jgi:hypothetical protein
VEAGVVVVVRLVEATAAVVRVAVVAKEVVAGKEILGAGLPRLVIRRGEIAPTTHLPSNLGVYCKISLN